MNGVFAGLDIDNYGGYMVVDANTSMIVAGERFDLSLEDMERIAADN